MKQISKLLLIVVGMAFLAGCATKVNYIPVPGVEHTQPFAQIRAKCIKEAGQSVAIGSGQSSASSGVSTGGILGTLVTGSVTTARGVIANQQIVGKFFESCMVENGYEVRCEGPMSGDCGTGIIFNGGYAKETYP